MSSFFLFLLLCCSVSSLIAGGVLLMRTKTPWLNTLKLFWIISVFLISAYLSYFLFESYSTSLVTGVFWVVITRITLGKRMQWRDLDKDIELLDALNWSWRRAGQGFLQGFAYIFVPVLFLGLFLELTTGWLRYELVKIVFAQQDNNLETILYFLLFPAILVGLLRSVFQGIQPRLVERKARPNIRIWLTLRNGVIIGSSIGIFVAIFLSLIISYLISPVFFGSLNSFAFILPDVFPGFLIFFACSTLTIMLSYGVIDFLNHFFLRATLIQQGAMPRKYAPFLDEAAKLLLLRKVGGGYIFIHRLVLEHFAQIKRFETLKTKTFGVPSGQYAPRSKPSIFRRLRPKRSMVYVTIIGLLIGASIPFLPPPRNELTDESSSEIYGETFLPAPTPTSGIYLTQAVVATRRLPVGYVLTENDVELGLFPNSNIFIQGGYAILDIETAIGQEILVPLDKGVPVLSSAIRQP